MSFILALDQGTTSSRAIVFDHAGDDPRASRSGNSGRSFRSPAGSSTTRPRSGRRSRACMHEALAKAGIGAARRRRDRHHQPARDDGACGTARPASRSPTRSSGRTGAPRALCDAAARGGPRADCSRARPGSCSTPTSPAPSSSGCSTTCPARARARERGELAFGTIDSWLVWNLTGGARARHRRVATRAARCSSTSTRGDWDDELLALLDIPRARAAARRRRRRASAPTRALDGVDVPIAGIAGDQQAALFGQACHRARPGEEHLRHRLLPAAEHRRRSAVASRNNLLTTVAWQRDGAHRLRARRQRVHRRRRRAVAARRPARSSARAAEIEALAASVPDNGGVYLVPAFAGLGAPHWDAYARGAIFGLTRGATVGAHRARRARSRSPSRAPTCCAAMQKRRRHHADASCASTAAPRRTTC